MVCFASGVFFFKHKSADDMRISDWSSDVFSSYLGDWDTAEARSGSQHLLRPPARFEAHSPFNYAAQAEVLIVTDIKKGDIAAMSGAYARLIEAAQGSGRATGREGWGRYV